MYLLSYNLYIEDEIERNRDDKKFGVSSQENHGRIPGRLDPGNVIRLMLNSDADFLTQLCVSKRKIFFSDNY